MAEGVSSNHLLTFGQLVKMVEPWETSSSWIYRVKTYMIRLPGTILVYIRACPPSCGSHVCWPRSQSTFIGLLYKGMMWICVQYMILQQQKRATSCNPPISSMSNKHLTSDPTYNFKTRRFQTLIKGKGGWNLRKKYSDFAKVLVTRISK